jgi:type IV secretion system protein VirD4
MNSSSARPLRQTTQVLPPPLQPIAQSLSESGLGWLILGLLILRVGIHSFSPPKGKISTGRFGSSAEKRAAAAIARRQRQQRRAHQVSLKASSLEIAEAQQGVAVCGAPNSGKTYSIIDPALRDAIRQGFPIVIYDFKGAQIEAHAAYAAAEDYSVHVFAPGFPYTGVCNPLDFVRDAADSLMAGQLAEVIYQNTRRGRGSSENDFFSHAGQKLVEAVLLLAKLTPYPDLLMAKKILNLPNLPTRIRLAGAVGAIPAWTLESFSQLLSSEDAEKQVAGIVATAQRVFDKMISKELIASFVGKTTIPLDLSGKQILFLQVDTQKREVVAPLLAAILHLIIARNFTGPRQDPLILSLDELPTLHLEGLPKWINEFRSYGFCPLLGYQNFAQLQHTYGRDLSKAIFAACGTKVFFNPRDDETAALISRYLGEKEVRLFTRSRSSGAQRSTSHNEQYQKVPLLSLDEVLKLDQGECVFINPAYKGRGEASVPLKLKLKVSDRDAQIQQRSETLWHSCVRDRLIQKISQQQIPENALDAEAEKRQQTAESLFPLEPQSQQPPPLSSVSQPSSPPPEAVGDDFDDLFDPNDYTEY